MKHNRKHTTRRIPVTAIKYTGPARPYANDTQVDTHTTQLTTFVNATTDATGVLSATLLTNGVTSNPEWTNLQELWGEYRVLAIELRYMPQFGPGYNTSNTPPIGMMGLRHSTSTVTPSLIQSVADLPGSKWFVASRPSTVVWRMQSTEEANFNLSTSSTSQGGILLYSGGGTPTTVFGRFAVTYLVQFKGRQ